MNEIEIDCGNGSNLKATLFFPWAISLGVNPQYGVVWSEDAYQALTRIGIEGRHYEMVDGAQHDAVSYVVIEFDRQEDLVMAKLAFNNVNQDTDRMYPNIAKTHL